MLDLGRHPCYCLAPSPPPRPSYFPPWLVFPLTRIIKSFHLGLVSYLFIDVAATLEVYCDGGDDTMLQKLDGLQDKKYAGYCLEVCSFSLAEVPFTKTFLGHKCK